MRFASLFAVLALCAACAQAQAPVQPPAEDGCARHQASFPPLLGGPGEAARTALLAMPGITTVRVVGPDQPVTMDYRHDRATVTVREGKVIRIACG